MQNVLLQPSSEYITEDQTCHEKQRLGTREKHSLHPHHGLVFNQIEHKL